MRGILLLVASTALAGCGSAPAPESAPPLLPPVAELSEPFPLAVGAAATLLPDGPKVRFLRVIEDSRCPTGTDCVRAGMATIEVLVEVPGFEFLTFPGIPAGPGRHEAEEGRFAETGTYRVHLLQLDPHPTAEQPDPPQSSYVSVLLIERVR